MSCIFCKIVEGSVPSMKVYEDDSTLVFMDIADDVDGHMVAIPKKHVTSIFDCDRETLDLLMYSVKKVCDHCKTDCGYDGVNLLNASGDAAGQSVGHFHIHIIPRKNDDGVDAWPSFTGAKSKRETVYQLLKI